MIWIFERDNRRAKLEVLYLGPNNYEVRFWDADGKERVEHFKSAEDVGNRQLDVEHSLAMQGWSRTGGWKL